MRRSKIYTFKIDSDLERTLCKFEKELNDDEVIKTQQRAGDTLVITTEIIVDEYARPKNLLLEEMQKRE